MIFYKWWDRQSEKRKIFLWNENELTKIHIAEIVYIITGWVRITLPLLIKKAQIII